MKRLHRLTGLVIAPTAGATPLVQRSATSAWWRSTTSTSSHPTRSRCSGPHAVKGLEFDGVIVVNPHEILGDSALGARLLYVAMTRAVQRLAFVTDAPAPSILSE